MKNIWIFILMLGLTLFLLSCTNYEQRKEQLSDSCFNCIELDNDFDRTVDHSNHLLIDTLSQRIYVYTCVSGGHCYVRLKGSSDTSQ